MTSSSIRLAYGSTLAAGRGGGTSASRPGPRSARREEQALVLSAGTPEPADAYAGAVRNDGRRPIWHEPRPGDAPPRGGSDWLLVGAFELAAVVEAIFRPEVAWRPLVTLLALATAPALLWRRSHPLVAALVGFGAAMVLSVGQLVTDSGDLGLYSMMFVLILLYSLVRWGSGREVVIGLGFIAVSVALGMYVSFVGWTDVFGGSVFLLMFVGPRGGVPLPRRRLAPSARRDPQPGAGRPGPRAARHRGPPRLRDRGAGAGRSCRRGHQARGGRGDARGDRERGDAHAGRDARDGARPPRRAGDRVRPAARHRGPVIAGQERCHPGRAGHRLGRARQPPPGDRRRGLPAGAGVADQRAPPRPRRHPGAHRGGRASRTGCDCGSPTTAR